MGNRPDQEEIEQDRTQDDIASLQEFHPISRWGLGRLSSEDFLTPVIGAMKETVRENGKPVVLALRPPQDLDGMKEFLAVQEAFVGAEFPVFHSMRKLARSVARVIEWKRTSQNKG